MLTSSMARVSLSAAASSMMATGSPEEFLRILPIPSGESTRAVRTVTSAPLLSCSASRRLMEEDLTSGMSAALTSTEAEFSHNGSADIRASAVPNASGCTTMFAPIPAAVASCGDSAVTGSATTTS